MAFVAHDQPTEILQPGKQALDLPAVPVAAQRTPILGWRFRAVEAMRRDQLNPPARQTGIQRITVIGPVGNQTSGNRLDETSLESWFHKGDFVRRSACNVNGEGNTSAVCHCHEFRALTALGFSHSVPPFFATTNVPSIKPSVKSSSPRCCKSAASASSTWRNTPLRAQAWKRRWQVWYGGKRSGKSAQGAPVRSTHKTPLSTSRLSRQGRPRPSARRGGLGISGSISAHCSSVSSSARRLAVIPPV